MNKTCDKCKQKFHFSTSLYTHKCNQSTMTDHVDDINDNLNYTIQKPVQQSREGVQTSVKTHIDCENKEVKTTMAFEDSSLWLNVSDSGRGILLTDNSEEDGDTYSVPTSQVEDMLDGERSGVNLSKIVEDEG